MLNILITIAYIIYDNVKSEDIWTEETSVYGDAIKGVLTPRRALISRVQMPEHASLKPRTTVWEGEQQQPKTLP